MFKVAGDRRAAWALKDARSQRYVYIYIYIYVYMYVCIYVYMYMCCVVCI